MKHFKLAAAAGLMVASMGMTASAGAQSYDHGGDHGGQYDQDRRGDDRDHRDDRGGYRDDRGGYRDDHGGYRDDRGDYRGDRGRYYGDRHRRCWTEWRHHRRVRICR